MFTPRSSTASDSASPAVESRRATAGRLREPTLWLARATPHSLYGLLDCGRRERPGSAAIVFLILVELGSRVPPAGQAGPRDHVMRGALGGPRVLLRRLREVMAEPVSAQERLNKIMVLIAANMVAEVCSVYVLRVDGTLELYASEGLNPNSVHVTVLGQDEGLVGLVASEAKSINLSDAQHHPAFSFRPETGEEVYHSFLGVPILRAGNTLGVLVVQNRAHRNSSEEEEDALQTTAMVLAETIASGELSALAKPGLEPAAHRPLQLEGLSISDGIGLGHAVLHEPRVEVKQLIADDPKRELQRLDVALN